jgi:uncharacterized protein (DUF983 family)
MACISGNGTGRPAIWQAVRALSTLDHPPTMNSRKSGADEDPQFWRGLWRSLRLRCPVCGQDRLFRGWFRMHPNCGHCGVKYERAPGYFLGSIYFNYGMTALLVVIVFFAVMLTSRMAPDALPAMLHPTATELRWLLAAFSILFPLWFFRYARSLWLGLDQYFDPLPRGDAAEASTTAVEDAQQENAELRERRDG